MAKPDLNLRELLESIRSLRESLPPMTVMMEHRQHISGTENLPDRDELILVTTHRDQACCDVMMDNQSDKIYRRSIYYEDRGGLDYVSNIHRSRLEINDEPEAGLRNYRWLSSRMFPVGWSLPEDDDSLDELFMKNLSDLKLEAAMEDVDGVACYVIWGTTPYGYYRVWIDPDHDFQLRRAEICKRKGDLYRDGRPYDASDALFFMDHVSLQRVGNYYLPHEASIVWQSKTHTSATSKVKKVLFNPDFNALGAFTTDWIPDGTPVELIDATGATQKDLEWRGGMARPIES